MDKPTLLIVDDAPDNIEVLGGWLEPRYHIKVAINGETALRLAATPPLPDLILLDVMMPAMDGYEVCRKLKVMPETQSIPVIFITALDDVEDEAKGLALGAVDYLTKPIRFAILEARVQTHLALYNQKRLLERQVAERTRELMETQRAIIESLGRAAEFKDNETGMHVLRVGRMARLLAEAAGYDERFSALIELAAPMHDVGKIGIADAILLKPGPLDADERAQMQRHTVIGATILGENRCDLIDMARTIALNHHERWDGKGYPVGTQSAEIPAAGRIVSIVDCFDALIHARPYKAAWPLEKAMDFITSNAGVLFDPKLVDLFVRELPAMLDAINTLRDPDHQEEGEK
ncbi:HD-GYP domain-containing protein [Parachitinimonas caeni]|uniref:Response regulator n=1 Tax=Parachitinimonas caeni TaxID=3031301 RepID=A0ABT7DRM5_9NEIS|nr:HD domain-containing phosphohydrolase [Parachitinimonas caeni]MDK2122722.1 response regulator [Parachitinimonas caeni]